MILVYLITVALCLYSMLLVFYRAAWKEIPLFTDNMSNPDIFFSVIIPARNEEENIRNCIDSILQQDYSPGRYEVIVVDDHSTDNTAAIAGSYPNSNIRLIKLQDVLKGQSLNSYKKKGIETAIAQSAGNWIVTTDADCIVPKRWLSSIAAFQKKYHSKLIAAPVSFYNESSFLEIFQSLDFMALQGVTGASVYKKFHSLCNGANLAYEKKIFEEVNGFKGIDDIASGDDLLLMHKIYLKNPEAVHYLKSRDTIVKTPAARGWREFFQQRIRWASKAPHYDDKRIFAVLLLVLLLNLSFFVLGISSFFSAQLFYWFVFLLLIKTLVELFFLVPVASFFSKINLLWWFIPSQPLHIIYTVLAGFLGKSGSYEWKGRRVK